MKAKNVVAGLGEIGKPIQKLVSKSEFTVGFDTNKKLMSIEQFQKNINIPTKILHICIPFRNNFHHNVISLCDKFSPECLVIHSTIQPHTTKKLQNKLTIPVIFSPIRGVHKRMSYDLKRYTKFFAIEPDAPKKTWAITVYSNLMKKCGVKVKKMSEKVEAINQDISFMDWNANGYSSEGGVFYKDGKQISVPICRECQVQAPCSRWGGKYPYEREALIDE